MPLCPAYGVQARTGHAMKFSIVIPTFNRSSLLRRTLRGLCEQMPRDGIDEVIVVSDGSTDGTPTVIPEFAGQLPIRLVSQGKAGVSAARNRGLGEVHGDAVLFLDDDVIPSPQLLREHAEFHRQKPRSESVCLGYVTWLPELRISPFMQWYGEYGALFGYALLPDGQPVDRRYLYTCNISFKTAFLRGNGGFNERLSVYEDHELGYRLSQRGMEMFFRRKALGYHNQSFTFQQACDRMQRYSSGMEAFLATDAGHAMIGGAAGWKRQLRRLVRNRDPHAPGMIRRLIDSEHRLPHSFYRLMYWYYATLPAGPESSEAAATSEER